MNVFVNGKELNLAPNVKTIEALIELYKLNPLAVIVEQNHTIVARDFYKSTLLANGDKIEIVHFVGGG